MRFTKMNLLVAVLVMFTEALTGCRRGGKRAENGVTDIRGVYVWVQVKYPFPSTNGQACQAALNVPGMDGMLLMGAWDTYEPAMGEYDFSDLDRWMSYATSLKKKIALTIRAGSQTPAWLFQPPPAGAGATELDFEIAPHDGNAGVCNPPHPFGIAAPWDPIFLARWDALLAALSAHLKSQGTYGAVTLLRLTGIDRASDELRLPAQTPQSTGLDCVSDCISTWQQAGYRPSKLLEAWDAITSSFDEHFPDKFFSVAIIPNPPEIAFPWIDEGGALITGTPPDQNQPLLELASEKFPGRLVIQFNFLFPGKPANPVVVQAAQTLGTMIAFQSNDLFSLAEGGAACGGSFGGWEPCVAQSYLTLLQTGIYPLGQSDPLRAQYLEVWATDANSFPEDIMEAHRELTSSSATGSDAGILSPY